MTRLTLGDFSDFLQETEKSWRRGGRREADLPALAEAALAGARFHERITREELLELLLAPGDLAEQKSPGSRFGEPPVTLAMGEELYLEAYFWRTPHTSLHDHGFLGAFQVLHGQTLHTRMKLEVTADYEHIQVGRLEPLQAALLRRGDIERITPGAGFVHQVAHLDVGSVSLVLRNHLAQAQDFTRGYFYPGIAARASVELPASDRIRLRVLDAALRYDNPQLLAQCRRALCGASDHAAFWQLLLLYNLGSSAHPRGGVGLVEQVLDDLPSWPRPWQDALLASLRWRQARRSSLEGLEQPSDRLFLGLLTYVGDRALIDPVLERWNPEESPGQQLAQWVDDALGRGLLQVELNDTARLMLRELIVGGSSAQVATRLQVELDASVDELTEDVSGLREQLLELPLLAAALPALERL